MKKETRPFTYSFTMAPYDKIVRSVDGGGKFYDLAALDAAKYARLPFSIKVLLESAVRNCDNFQVNTYICGA